MRGVVTVIGKDKVGIIANISKVLAKNNINILDISQTTMQEIFTMVMLIDISEMSIDFLELSDELDEIAKNLNLSVKVQHEEIFDSMHRI